LNFGIQAKSFITNGFPLQALEELFTRKIKTCQYSVEEKKNQPEKEMALLRICPTIFSTNEKYIYNHTCTKAQKKTVSYFLESFFSIYL